MNKAVIGVFPDSMSASRAINNLKAYGFPGEAVSQVVRDNLARGRRLPGPRLMPGMEPLKGLIIGIIVGGILGGLGYLLIGLSVSWTSYRFSSPLYSAIISMAIVGGIAGLLEGLAALGPLVAARRALLNRHRGDSMMTVHTDEAHADRAAEIMVAAGAHDVRRGASSVMDEFRTVEMVQPETYGTPTQVVQRETVEAPAANEPVSSDGGAVG